MPRLLGGLRPHFMGQHAADREAKQASLQSSAQQLIVIPNMKPHYLPEEKAIITRLLQEGAQP